MRPATCTARVALRSALAAGLSGSYVALAAAAGVPPPKARATLKEMRRLGECQASGRGCVPATYGRPAANQSPFDALAHVRAFWR